MKFLNAIINFFWNIGCARDIKNNPRLAPVSKHFGIKSMASAVIAVISALLMSILPLMGDGMGGLLIVFWIALFAAGAIGCVFALLGAIFNWFLQLYVNRSAMTWISLVFLIAGLAGVGAIIIWIASLF